MKKITKTLLALSLLTAFTFTSCEGIDIKITPDMATSSNVGITEPPQNNGEQSNGTQSNGVSFAEANVQNFDNVSVNLVRPNEASTVPEKSFTDGKYNYFYFKLGEILNAPMYYSNLKEYNGVGSITLTVENSASVSSMIEKSSEICINNAVDKEISGSLSWTAGVGQDDATGAAVSGGFEQSEVSSYSLTTSESYTTSITQTITQTSAHTLTLDHSDPVGSYRFFVYSDLEVYAVVICDLDTKKVNCKYLTAAIEGTQREGWYYGDKDSLTVENKTLSESDKLHLDDSALDGIDLFGSLSKVMFLRKYTVYQSDAHATWSKAILSGGTISNLLNEDTINALGVKTAIMRIRFTYETPSGEAKITVKTYSSYSVRNSATLIGSWSATANSTAKEKTLEYRVDINKLLAGDDRYGIEFHSENDGFFDWAKNSCDFTDIVVTFELV